MDPVIDAINIVEERMMATKKKTSHDRNPQDGTLRNVRASLKRDNALLARLLTIELQLDQLMQQVAEIRMEGIASRIPQGRN